MKRKILLSLVILSGIIAFMAIIEFKNPFPPTKTVQDNSIVLAIGLDRGIENNENIRLTIISNKFNSDSNKSTEAKRADIFSAEGRTVAEAIQNFNTFLKKEIYLGQIKYIILGDELARENVMGYIDYFTRDYDVRLNTTVLTSCGITAEELLIIGTENGEFTPDTLTSLFKNSKRLSISSEQKLSDLMMKLDSAHVGEYIPSVKTLEEIEPYTTGEEYVKNEVKRRYLSLDGYAIFNDTNIIGYVSGSLARGLSFASNRFVYGVTVLEDYGLSLDIIKSVTKTSVKLNSGKVSVNVKVELSVNIAEQSNKMKFDFNTMAKEIELSQSKIVKKEVEDIYEYTKEHSVDLFGIGDKVYHKYPLKWDSMINDWDKIYSEIEVNVEVDTRLNRTYYIINPIGSEGK